MCSLDNGALNSASAEVAIIQTASNNSPVKDITGMIGRDEGPWVRGPAYVCKNVLLGMAYANEISFKM